MGDYFDVKVISKRGRRVKLALKALSSDAMLFDDASFALMMLVESIDAEHRQGPFGEEVGLDDVLDERWQKKYARGFVSSVRAVPRQRSESGTLEIEVTHAAWIAHLQAGARWKSRAFSLGITHDACKAIAPPAAGKRRRASGEQATDDAFMVVPRECWARFVTSAVLAAMPASGVLVPAYGEKTYRARDEKRGVFRAADVVGLNGQCVRVVDGKTPVVGSLFVHGDEMAVLKLGTRSLGYWASRELRGSIGVLERKPKGLRAERHRYADVLSFIEPQLVSATRAGNAVELIAHLSPARATAPGLEDVLFLLFTVLDWSSVQFHGQRPGQRLRPCTLSSRLEQEMQRFEDADEARFPNPATCAARIAALGAHGRFFSSFEVSKPAHVPDLDTASSAVVRAFFAAALPIEVRVRLRLVHAKDFLPLLETPIVPIALNDFPARAPGASMQLYSLKRTDPRHPKRR